MISLAVSVTTNRQTISSDTGILAVAMMLTSSYWILTVRLAGSQWTNFHSAQQKVSVLVFVGLFYDFIELIYIITRHLWKCSGTMMWSLQCADLSSAKMVMTGTDANELWCGTDVLWRALMLVWLLCWRLSSHMRWSVYLRFWCLWWRFQRIALPKIILFCESWICFSMSIVWMSGAIHSWKE